VSRSALRSAVLVLGALLGVVALLLAFARCFPAAGIVAGWAVVLFVGLLIERWRYKPLSGVRPGPDWQATDERFVDPETGKLVTVYFHPATGERRYVA
jgi:uncharacterized membrane protein